MPITPTSSIAKFLSNLQSLIAASPAFQAWVGATGANPAALAASAAARVYLVGLPAPASPGGYTLAEMQNLRPFAFIGFHVRQGAESVQVAQSTNVESARMLIAFEDNVAAGQNYADAVLTFLNQFGSTLEDMAAMAGQDGYLNVHSLQLEKGPIRADQTEAATRGDYHSVMVAIEAGI